MTNSIFGMSERALQLCEDRAVVITNNLVNSSTPNFKARDINFQDALSEAQGSAHLDRTNESHLTIQSQAHGADLLYRIPMQSSLDGNTVDDEIERKNFLENAVRYQVNLSFIQNKTDQLMKAIKGE